MAGEAVLLDRPASTLTTQERVETDAVSPEISLGIGVVATGEREDPLMPDEALRPILDLELTLECPEYIHNAVDKVDQAILDKYKLSKPQLEEALLWMLFKRPDIKNVQQAKKIIDDYLSPTRVGLGQLGGSQEAKIVQLMALHEHYEKMKEEDRATAVVLPAKFQSSSRHIYSFPTDRNDVSGFDEEVVIGEHKVKMHRTKEYLNQIKNNGQNNSSPSRLTALKIEGDAACKFGDGGICMLDTKDGDYHVTTVAPLPDNLLNSKGERFRTEDERYGGVVKLAPISFSPAALEAWVDYMINNHGQPGLQNNKDELKVLYIREEYKNGRQFYIYATIDWDNGIPAVTYSVGNGQ